MDVRPITVLAGGVGAARFLQGLLSVVPAEDVAIIGNVGDDLEVAGLHVSPDLDTVLYTLTGWIDEKRGWGVRGDSDRALDRAAAWAPKPGSGWAISTSGCTWRGRSGSPAGSR